MGSKIVDDFESNDSLYNEEEVRDMTAPVMDSHGVLDNETLIDRKIVTLKKKI